MTGANPFIYTRADGRVLRGRLRPACGRGLVVFLSGFRSHHMGEKATAIDGFAAERGLGCLRFDYLGHGESDGGFAGFRISEAVADSAGCIGAALTTPQPLYLVGSSMGGWIALQLAAERLVRHALPVPDGLLLIAPALDFVSRRLAQMSPEMRHSLDAEGQVQVPDRYAPGTTYPISRHFLDDALALEPQAAISGVYPIDRPVRIVHGSADESVPLATSQRLQRGLPNATLQTIEGGDHRLSAHMDTLLAELDRLLGE